MRLTGRQGKCDRPPNERYQDWRGGWTGKDGVESRNDFLNSPTAQEHAIREWLGLQWSWIEEYNLQGYVGKTIGGIEITTSGMLAESHLAGIRSLGEFLESNGTKVFVDGYGTKISDCISDLDFYDTPFDNNPPDPVMG